MGKFEILTIITIIIAIFLSPDFLIKRKDKLNKEIDKKINSELYKNSDAISLAEDKLLQLLYYILPEKNQFNNNFISDVEIRTNDIGDIKVYINIQAGEFPKDEKRALAAFAKIINFITVNLSDVDNISLGAFFLVDDKYIKLIEGSITREQALNINWNSDQSEIAFDILPRIYNNN